MTENREGLKKHCIKQNYTSNILIRGVAMKY